MPTVKSAPDAVDKTVHYRGLEIRMHELDIEEYDDLLKKATQTRLGASGQDEEWVDEQLLVRMMLQKSLVSPPFKELPHGMRLVRQLERDVRDLHFGAEPEVKKADKKDDDEGDSGPNQDA